MMDSSANLVADRGMRKEMRPIQPKSRRKLWITLGIVFAILVAAGVTVGVLIQQKIIPINSSSADSSASSDSGPDSGGRSGGGDSDTGLITPDDDEEPPKLVKCSSENDVPRDARGTFTDPTSWLDMTGFNCTYTDETVGDLPLVGLNSTWDDSARANPNVPPLDEPWGPYDKRPARGVNLGGWLSLEPFITPSLFDFDEDAGVVDEWSLSDHLGPEKAAETLENHYATFITERDFRNIAAAGLDHIRIPFSYWAVETYEGDAYVPRVSWRYLLRGIEWARKYGLRVKLDLHGMPGSQNGWNHSGRASKVNFISGPDGKRNAERALEVHDRLSKFFAQDRYRNVVAFYGLGNEPASQIPLRDLAAWTEEAYDVVRGNGVRAPQVFSDSMRATSWQGQFADMSDTMVMDSHIYAIFDNGLIAKSPREKIELACKEWTAHVQGSMDRGSGFGPTMVGEWSQADTDCTTHLNGVRNGNRWTGTWFDTQGTARCPADECSCDDANAKPEDYSDEYRLFLKTWGIAQMDAYEKTWGWFYWTWKTETAYQWSYEHGLKGGYMPKVAYERDWDCSKPVPSFKGLWE